MTTVLAERGWVMTIAQFEMLSRLCDAETAIDILGVRGRSGQAVGRAPDLDLRGSGLGDEFGADPELETALRILAVPDLVYSLRRWARGDGDAGRSVVAAAGGSAAVVHRRGDNLFVELMYSSHPASLAAAVWSCLDGAISATSAPAMPQWRTPLRTLAEATASAANRHELGATLATQGCPESAAGPLARALDADIRTEIVASQRRDGDTRTSVGTVAVFDGETGRLITAPDIASDGALWVTFSPASRTRLEQALAKLFGTVPAGPSP